jgi:hypothetical protein
VTRPLRRRSGSRNGSDGSEARARLGRLTHDSIAGESGDTSIPEGNVRGRPSVRPSY